MMPIDIPERCEKKKRLLGVYKFKIAIACTFSFIEIIHNATTYEISMQTF